MMPICSTHISKLGDFRKFLISPKCADVARVVANQARDH